MHRGVHMGHISEGFKNPLGIYAPNHCVDEKGDGVVGNRREFPKLL